jgi:prophage tail gpP-like protein
MKAKGENWETDRLLSYEIESTLEKGADKFSITVGFGQKGENANKIKPGKKISLFDTKGTQLLTGMIDDVDEGKESIEVSGRDLMAYAIESYPEPKHYKNAYPKEIMQELAGRLPFKSVDFSRVTSKQAQMPKFNIEAGESYCDVFQKLLEYGDFDLFVDPLGNLCAVNFPDNPASILFRFVSKIGEANCTPTLKLTTHNVFSTIRDYSRGRKKGGTKGYDETDADIAKIVQRTKTQKEHAKSEAQGKKKIEHEFRDMKDRMRRWTITYGGPHEKFGTVPKLGDGILITSYRHRVENEPATVWKVQMRLSARGHETIVDGRSRKF